MLQVFARVLKWIYHKIYNCAVRRRNAHRYGAIIKEVEAQHVTQHTQEVGFSLNNRSVIRFLI